MSELKKQNIYFTGKTNDHFLKEVREEVDRYFVETKTPKTGDWIVYTKAFLLLSSAVFCYLSLMFGWMLWMPRIFLWICLGISKAFVAINIGHDAIHGSLTNKPRLNKILGYIAFDLVGLSSWVWKHTHNQDHHTFTNISGKDPDIHKPGILRLSPNDPYYPINRFQHWYVWLLYTLVSFNWIFYSDYSYVWHQRNKIKRKDLILFFLFKCINYSYMILIPLLFGPFTIGEVILGYIAVQMAGGLTVSIIFQLAHIVENVEFPNPTEEGVIKMNWGEHEMRTTANFGTHNFFLTQALGGLNFQIEHHLFPTISHAHYQKIFPIVKKVAQKYGFPYHENPSMTAAVQSHMRLLKKLSKKSS